MAYAQVLFSDHAGVGALLLLATALSPRIGLSGLTAVLLGHALVRLLALGEAAAARGRYGYNPLLVGLAVGALFEPGAGAAALLALAVVAVVFLEAALESALGAVFALPLLSLPSVFVTWLALAAAPLVGIVSRTAPSLVPEPAPDWLPGLAALYLRSLGAIFFSPSLAAGALVLAGLVLQSRIATLLSLVGFGVAAALTSSVFTLASDGALLVLCANAMLTAVALGGIWFVPQRSAFLLAAGAALLTALSTVGAHGAAQALRPAGPAPPLQRHHAGGAAGVQAAGAGRGAQGGRLRRPGRRRPTWPTTGPGWPASAPGTRSASPSPSPAGGW